MWICFLSTLAYLLKIDYCESEATLIDNGYTRVLIAIDPVVPEDENLIKSIKSMMTNASADLFTATNKRAYFKEITILVPKSWTSGTYASSNSEIYKLADIRIAPPHPALQHNPYALTWSTCGEKGGGEQYIHLTPDYITNPNFLRSYGSRGKVVVHEWGHYRWGVKDEYPTNKNDKFYLSSSGYARPTGCSGHIAGKIIDSNGNTCEAEEGSRLPSTSRCNFVRYSAQPDGIKSSMMYKQFIGQISTFCHNDSSDPLNMHNSEAMNNQNRKCNHQSTWEVIFNSDDFQNGAVNVPNTTIQNTIPVFKVVRPGAKRIVLIMDVSGSMYGKRLDDLRSASANLISNLIGDGTMVGIVAFSESAVVLQPLTMIGFNDDSRENVINSLPSSVNGSTGIGAGILKGIEVLMGNGESPEGGRLIVLTDGEENTRPYVENIATEVLETGVVVESIFFGLVDATEDASLAEMSIQTGGKWYYASTSDKSISQLSGIFAALSESDDGDVQNKSVQISNKILDLEAGKPETSAVALDSSVGSRTIFFFAWTGDEPIVALKPPSTDCIYSNFEAAGKTNEYCNDGPIHKVYKSSKTIKFSIPGIANFGIWEYSVLDESSDNQVTCSVSSAPSDPTVYPITVSTELKIVDPSGKQPPVVTARAFQNLLPVLGATVEASITRPDDKNIVLELLDNGSGADAEKNDGVYSRYFTQFSLQGRHAVEVHVTRKGKDVSSSVPKTSATDFDAGVILEDGTYLQNPDSSTTGYIGVNVEGVIERSSSCPGFAYTGPSTAVDIFPPNKITDLVAHQIDLDDAAAGIFLEFTAPGDDYDNGNASSYEIRYTFDSLKPLLPNFEDQILIKDEWLTEGNLTQSKGLLLKENISFVIPDLPKNETIRIAFSMRAYDEVKNPSETSNIAMTTFFTKPPPIPEKIESNLKWIIIGVAVGAVALAAMVVLLVYFVVCRRRSKQRRKEDE